MDAYEAIMSRRSVRGFDGRPVPQDVIDRALRAALVAPAPHHTQPWRFVVLETPESRMRLADAMGAAWRRDLEGDGVAPAQIEKALVRSRSQIEDAPALLLGCLVHEGLRDWPDKRRRRAEWRMAVQSMGCALENIMVSARADGVASFWISAPLFCAEAVRAALALPDGYEAQALVALGCVSDAYTPRERPEPDLTRMTERR